ncbi:MAG: zinc-binding alcohol dehydrogenase family protein [Lysobacterales bacterium]
MYGFNVRQFGGPEVMVWEQLPDLKPTANQVLVDVYASGVNFAETRMRSGTYSGQPLPFVMGMEGAGVVREVGPGVTEFSQGDRVFGRARGTHAEQVLFDAAHLMALPDNLSFEEGAGIPVGWLTAWHALHTVAEISQGQRVLVEAVGGSVGSAALQIAKQQGCWVAGTASRDGKLKPAKAQGADLLINYNTQSISDEVRQGTDGKGADVSLMTIGGATSQELLDSMGMDGKVVMFGSTGGRDITFNLNIGMLNIQMLSMSISTSPLFETQTMASFREHALPLFADGTFTSVVDKVLPMSRVVDSHQMIDDRNHYGKVILAVDR